MEDKINQLLLNLNGSWYAAKKAIFLKETFYVPKYGKIYQELDESFDTEKVVIDIDLVEYCWYDKYPNSLSSYDQEETFPVNASSISWEIVSHLVDLTRDVNDVSAVNTCIIAAIETVNETIRTLLTGNTNEIFEKALEYFVLRFKEDLSNKFGHIKRIAELTATHTDKLSFTINQEQLGALLYILNRAGIIENPYPNDTSFLTFCSKYFYFKNQIAGKSTKATGLRNKYNDAKSPYSKARDKIVKLLKEAFEDL